MKTLGTYLIEMKMSEGFLLILIGLGLVLTSVLVHAQDDQSGFVSIDCGIGEGQTYTDGVTNINYVSDANFTESSEIHDILPEYKSIVSTQLMTLTSFPNNTRNCYTLKPTQGKGNKYLIRARFLYGNYDKLGKLPEFDLHLGPDYWDTIKINSSSLSTTLEIIHVLLSDYMHLCLVNTGRGTPFISAIEIRPLKSDMYTQTDFGSLNLYGRYYFGNDSGTTIRYEADKYDRRWFTDSLFNTTSLNTTGKINTNNTFDPPSEIMSSAITPTDPTKPLRLFWFPPTSTDQFLIYMYFAEVQVLTVNQTREFDIYVNEGFYYEISPTFQVTTTVFSAKPAPLASKYTIVINKTQNSTLPPIINALELYTLKVFPQKQTYDKDVAAMRSIKSTYRVTKNWQGDPCAPHEFVWDGITCSDDDTEFPRIIMEPSTSGLNGGIYSGIANLSSMQTLDLSNNNLTGSVPDFLSGLKFLKELYLKGNNFTAPIPSGLLAKANKGSLLLSFDGETTSFNGESTGDHPCDGNICKKKKKNKKTIVALIAVGSVVAFFIALALVWKLIRKKHHVAIDGIARSGSVVTPSPATTTVTISTVATDITTRKVVAPSATTTTTATITTASDVLHSITSMWPQITKKRYTYSDIQTITENFKVVLGKGGSGEVYHGTIGGTDVAVKLLSKSSQHHENKQFRDEARLLLGVHHKNLTTLIGYCNDESIKGIIYEYMANGDLESRLLDKKKSVLNWEERLQIGCDAAHGLEYMHHGCKTPVVHRDVKCTNILLNEASQAKLGDFGVSRAFPVDDSHIITDHVAGTFGYIDPEYLASGKLTTKSDVFSFGVVLLVLITGQPAITKKDNSHLTLNRIVSAKLEYANMNDIVDPTLHGDYDVNSAWKVVELAMTCVSPTPNERPTMKEVVMELNECLATERARKKAIIPNPNVSGFMSIDLELAHDPTPV